MEWLKWVLNIFICVGIAYIGWRQTLKYREDDKKERLEKEYRESIKQAFAQLKEDIFFMFDNHVHDVSCNNENCKKVRTTKTYINLPQQGR